MLCRRAVLAVALVSAACSSEPSDPAAPFRGIWQLQAYVGHSLPAVTATGDTMVAGYLQLVMTELNGSIASREEHCLVDQVGATAGGESARWVTIGGDSAIMFYPDATGFPPIDTLVVHGSTLEYTGRIAYHGEGRWTLTKLSDDQFFNPPPVCVSRF
jgi:hypothetical protein